MKLSNVKIVAVKYKISMQKALTILNRKSNIQCPKCNNKSVIEYLPPNNGGFPGHECLICDYDPETELSKEISITIINQ